MKEKQEWRVSLHSPQFDHTLKCTADELWLANIHVKLLTELSTLLQVLSSIEYSLFYSRKVNANFDHAMGRRDKSTELS